MKNLVRILTLAAISLGFSSCCSMFGNPWQFADQRTETRKVKTCGYDIVTEQVMTPGGKGGMVKTVEKKVPRYKTVTVQKFTPCAPPFRFYCPKKVCGSTSESTMREASSQGSVGSPNIGLIPTMKELPLSTKKSEP